MCVCVYTRIYMHTWGFPDGSDGKESACNVGNQGLKRSPREGNSYPLQYSCLENSTDRGAWRATVYGIAKNLCKEILHNHKKEEKNLVIWMDLEGTMLSERNKSKKGKYWWFIYW